MRAADVRAPRTSRRTWPTRRAARSSRGWGRRRPPSRRSSSSSRSSGPRSTTTSREALLADPALDHWRHHLAVAAQVPPVPPLRARGEDRHREDRLRRLGLVAALRGAARRAARRRSTARSRLARDRDGAALRHRPRRAARRRRGDHRGARPGPPDAHVRLQHDPARQVDRRPAARLPDLDLVAQPRERDDRRGRRGADRGDDLALRRRRSATTGSRRGCSGSTGSTTTTASRRSSDDAAKTPWDEARRVVVERVRATSRTRRARSSRGSSTTTGSTRPSGPTSARRVLRDDRAGRPPVRAHELHRRPPLDPHARARARARAARRRSRSRSACSTRRRR